MKAVKKKLKEQRIHLKTLEAEEAAMKRILTKSKKIKKLFKKM